MSTQQEVTDCTLCDTACCTHDKETSIKDLEGLKSYQNPEMVSRFATRHGVSELTAQELFEECKMFLAVCGVSTEPCSPSKEIDEMWHHFILHTKDYADFCERFIGRFLHHNPTETPNKGNMGDMQEMSKQMFGMEIPTISDAIIACSSQCSHDNYCDSFGE